MKKIRRPFLLSLVLAAGLVAACVTSGPQQALNVMADALDKKDSAAFLNQIDMKPFAANEVRSMTREDEALNTLDSMGRMLGLGGMEDLLGSVIDMETRLHKRYMRGVGTGELTAQCREADTPDCPWVAESLRAAKVVDLGPDAAVAQVTTPARMTSWLALRKVGDRWLVVGQAMMEGTAREYAAQKPVPDKPAKPAPDKPTKPADPAPQQPKDAPAPDNRADGQGVTRL